MNSLRQSGTDTNATGVYNEQWCVPKDGKTYDLGVTVYQFLSSTNYVPLNQQVAKVSTVTAP